MDANLVLLSKNGGNKIFPLPKRVTVIGRRKNCDLRIPLESVSRRHCQFDLENQSLKLKDLGSRNGTFLNGNRIEEQILKPGDSIKIGPVVFAMQIDGQPEKIVAPPEDSPARASSPDETDVIKSPGNADSELDLDLDGSGSLGDLSGLDSSIDDLDEL
jgi:pSer/pThr/pTyr-binding forkhead associated (FHA) protein